jgi:hypothetical protein
VDVKASSKTLFDDIYLKCVVQGNPSPNVWWTKNGSYIQGYNIEFQDNNRTLIITRAASDDVGTYYCHARNKVSYVNAPFVLNLICKVFIFHSVVIEILFRIELLTEYSESIIYHLFTETEGNSVFCGPETAVVARGEAEGNNGCRGATKHTAFLRSQ